MKWAETPVNVSGGTASLAEQMYCSNCLIVSGLCRYTWSFQVSPQKEITGVHVGRIGRPIHSASSMCGIIQSNHAIIKMFVQEIKDVGPATWPGTFLHKPGGVRILYHHKFMKNVQIAWFSTHFVSEKLANESFGRNGGPNYYFFRMQGRCDCNMGVYGSPYAIVLFIDGALQVRMSFVSKQMLSTWISPSSILWTISLANVPRGRVAQLECCMEREV